MPGKVKVRVIAARGLPVMDRSTDLTDAFVEIKFGSDTQKTDVCKKSLSPLWNSEWFKFEVEDEVLQDDPLELRVLDHDTYSAHDAIGKVYVDLNPLLVKDSPSMINGWFPIYDTMHGIRGELNVIVKIELFSDFNKFRQSSCGIQFFCTAEVPSGFRLQYVHGFVEELVVNDDPEYQWIDKIRTPRSSNEARQRLFSKMSGQLTRKIGLKVLEMGGSAVIGYNQCFDLEGESGIVIRGIGTAVTLNKLRDPPGSPLGMSPLKDCRRVVSALPLYISTPIRSRSGSTPSTPVRRNILAPSHSNPLTAPLLPPSSTSQSQSAMSSPGGGGYHPQASQSHFAFDFTYSSPVPEETIAPSSPPMQNTRNSTSPVKVTGPTPARRSSDSDVSTPPKGNSLGGSSGSGSGTGSTAKNFPKPCSQQINIELMEFPLFTMTSFQPGFIVNMGGVVVARSVKLLDKIHNPEEPETRDAWWTEIRTEIRSHTRAMGCHAVIGYTETTSICDEIIVLSATGTAARVNLNLDVYAPSVRPSPQSLVSTVDRHLAVDKDRDHAKKLYVDVNLANTMSQRSIQSSEDSSPLFNCSLCHIPYKASSVPFPINLSQCSVCRRKYVPDVLFTTIDPPQEIQTLGKAAFIQARVCRPKADSKAEANAKEISDILPFMEYELHNQLMNKLKIRSMNGLFGLKVQIVVGENMVIGIATATGAYLLPLPAPSVPKIMGQVTSEEENVVLMELQKRVRDQLQKNKDIYQLNGVELSGQPSPHSVNTDDSDAEDDGSDLELSNGNKDTFVLEVDDTRDETISAMLHDLQLPTGMDVCNTGNYPGLARATFIQNLQTFTQVFKRTIEPGAKLRQNFVELFDSLYRKLFFKLHRMTPCYLCNIDMKVDIPEEDEIQIVVNGVCVAVDDTVSQNNSYNDGHGSSSSSKSLLKPAQQSGSGASGDNADDMMFTMEEVTEASAQQSGSGASGDNVDDMMFTMEEVTEASGSALPPRAVQKVKPEILKRKLNQLCHKQLFGIEITPLSFVSGARIEKYIGSYNFFFIRETTSVRESGGVCGFMQSFIAEVLAIVRANVSSLGGNALVAYKMTQCVLMTNEHKNQSQCLINVCGDAVFAVKEGDITTIVPDFTRKHSESPSSNT